MKMIIVGCGRMGAGLAHALSAKGHVVTVIDRDPAAFDLLPDQFKGRKITGIGFDKDILVGAGIEKCDGLAAVTSSDEANVVIARLASQVFSVPKVVTRLYDKRKADIYKRLGLQTIDPVDWGVNRVVDLLCYSPLNTVLSIGGGDVDIVKVEVPALLTGKTVREVTAPGEFQIVAITRGNSTFIPTLGTAFQKRDVLHLSVMVKSGDHLKSLLGLA